MLEQEIKMCKNAGMLGIKVECEANIGAQDDDDTCYDCEGSGVQNCDCCDGEGNVTCDECDGTGSVEVFDDEGDVSLAVCKECTGDGSWTCEDCNGSGEMTCSSCHGRENNSCTHDNLYSTIERKINRRLGDNYTQKVMKWNEVYRDGSVDTEWTYTLPIENMADILVLNRIFDEACEEVGDNYNLDGAGMHISLMPNTHIEHCSLDEEKLDNFSVQMDKVLQGLYLIASKGGYTRDRGYRQMTISDNEKYSAIYTHESSFIEYRIFDCVYTNEKILKNFLRAIAGSMKYYSYDNVIELDEPGEYEMVLDDSVLYRATQNRRRSVMNRVKQEMSFLLKPTYVKQIVSKTMKGAE